MYAWVSAAGGRAAHDPAFAGDPDGQERLERPELSRPIATPRWTQALDAAERELDKDEAPRALRRHPALYAEDLPVLPLFFRVDPFVIPKPLKGVRPTGHLNSSTLWIEQWRWEN